MYKLNIEDELHAIYILDLLWDSPFKGMLEALQICIHKYMSAYLLQNIHCIYAA